MAADRPKQYLPLAGQSVIEHTLGRLLQLPGLEGAYLGLSAGDPYWPTLPDTTTGNHLIHVFSGGAERAHTVLHGLRAMLSDGIGRDEWVLVHDAARPCIDVTLVQRLVSQSMRKGAGAILALPVADTVKRVNPEGRIQETVSRDGLWRAQTPQMFRLGMLHDAIEKALAAGFNVTDEASAMEYAGHAVYVVEGSSDNLKITVPADLVQAEQWLSS